MERDGRSRVITFFAAEALAPGALRLGGDAAQHARARRVGPGDAARVLDGRGNTGEGQITGLSRDEVALTLARVSYTPAPAPLEVVIPVADRDRMLFAAEKCTELGVTAWRPACFARSRSVSPRGEGEKFRARVVARMQSALEQSAGTWLPATFEEAEALDVLAAVPSSFTRVVLDSSGTSLLSHMSRGPIALAVGPEGGLEPEEMEGARAAGWSVASLGPTTLRFETAIIAAVSVVRALQHSSDT